MYQRILVPVDDSVSSQAALKEAARFAKLCPTALIRVIHVVDLGQTVSSISEFAQAPSVTQLEEALRHTGQGVLDSAMTVAKEAGFTPETVLVETWGKSRADVVVEDATAWNAELIIMGTHGYSGLKHLLVGSVAEGVIRHASMPVLLVRTPE